MIILVLLMAFGSWGGAHTQDWRCIGPGPHLNCPIPRDSRPLLRPDREPRLNASFHGVDLGGIRSPVFDPAIVRAVSAPEAMYHAKDGAP